MVLGKSMLLWLMTHLKEGMHKEEMVKANIMKETMKGKETNEGDYVAAARV